MTTALNEKELDLISNLSKAYTDTLEKIQQRRELWKNSTRENIHKVLENILSTAKLKNMNTQKVLGCENLEAVNIGFYQTASGIVLIDGKEVKSAEKHGGRLYFSQAYNGKIFVIILYPYIDDYVDQMDNNLIGTHEPEEFSNELIVNYFEKFMSEMIKWETNDRKPIGY
jgi:hypothetical protein